MFDLHIHSELSDGDLTPQRIIDRAISEKLRTIALADHDIAGKFATYSDYRRDEIDLIPATELSVGDYPGLHILGYGIKDGEAIDSEIRNVRLTNMKRYELILEKFNNQMGANLTIKDVLYLSGKELPSRVDIARKIVDLGLATDTRDAYELFIGPKNKNYVPTEKISSEKTIRLIASSAGLSVWAHPYNTRISREKYFDDDKVSQELSKLQNLGLQGVECFNPKMSVAQSASLIQIAKKRDLLITGGSDFHLSKRDRLGCRGLTEKNIDDLKSRL